MRRLHRSAAAMLPEKPMGTLHDDGTGLRGGPDPAWAGLLEEAAGRPEFFFIQIGAADGRIGDPIHHLVERHRWRGILVEPLPHMFAALRLTYRHRPDLVLENAAIAAEAGTRTLHYLRDADRENLPPWYRHLGSFHREVVLKHTLQVPRIGELLATAEVRCITFAQLLDRHDVTRIDLLHLDVEGAEAEVLSGVDLDRLPPAMILYEHCHLEPDDAEACAARLRSHGYRLVRGERDTLAVRGVKRER